MKRCAIFFVMLISLTIFVGNVGADSIKGRLGITGQVGFIVPSDGELTPALTPASGVSKLNIDSGFVGGGGLIYGIGDNFAVEAHVAYAPTLDVKYTDVKITKLNTIDASLGFQIRSNLLDEKHITAYLGGGVDVLFANVDDIGGYNFDISTVVGGHVNGGGDYFITKNLALNLDLRGVFFPDANVKTMGTKVATYDPISFMALFGVRWFPW